MLKKHLYTILFVSWVMFITLLSLFSFSGFDNTIGIAIPHMDKITHFTFYTVFVVLGYFFLKERGKGAFKSQESLLKIIFAAIIYGIFIEALQYAMPFGRAAEFFDVLANSAGAIFGGLLIKKYFSLSRKLK
ncbi:VanZ family protein [uncultured Croceitalea sp.]|uniref:VanZ family protein n=1 Tax=uncultured Croceitalea sp. TaxID=1798908 RepID=UPI00330615AE